MKNLLPFLIVFYFFVSLNSNAQKKPAKVLCSDIFKTEVDQFTKVESKFLKKPIHLLADNEKIILDVFTSTPTVILSFMFVKSQCVEAASDIDFLFEDDQSLSFQNSDKFNCDGNLSVSFTDETEYDKFVSKKIKAIRLRTSKKRFTVNLSATQAVKIKQVFTCLVKK